MTDSDTLYIVPLDEVRLDLIIKLTTMAKHLLDVAWRQRRPREPAATYRDQLLDHLTAEWHQLTFARPLSNEERCSLPGLLHRGRLLPCPADLPPDRITFDQLRAMMLDRLADGRRAELEALPPWQARLQISAAVRARAELIARLTGSFGTIRITVNGE